MGDEDRLGSQRGHVIVVAYDKCAVLFTGLGNSGGRSFHAHVFDPGVDQRLGTLGLFINVIPAVRGSDAHGSLRICVLSAQSIGIDGSADRELVEGSGESELWILVLGKQFAGVTCKEHTLIAADLVADQVVDLVAPLRENDFRMLCRDFGQIGSVACGCADDQAAALVDQLFGSCLCDRLVCVIDGFENDQVLLRNAEFFHSRDDALVCRLAPAAVIHDIGLDLTDLQAGKICAFRRSLILFVLPDQVDSSRQCLSRDLCSSCGYRSGGLGSGSSCCLSILYSCALFRRCLRLGLCPILSGLLGSLFCC